jgi:hypothetical protein
MRIGLIAALKHTETGALRAELPLAGRSVIAWQAALLEALGVERVLCLADRAGPEIIAVQHAIEADGAGFHALKGFAALPALVRAEDDLIILADGLVPDPALVLDLMSAEGGVVQRMVTAIPADHPLAVAHPEDFERIDAARHWAGVLAMRGAPVQQLADFPADADAISLLLRLALQAGTPCRDIAPRALAPETWLMADEAAAVMAHEQALIARAAPDGDWRAPFTTLAARLVRALAPRGLMQGGLIAGGIALALLLGAVMLAAFGPAAAALGLAGLAGFAAAVSRTYSALAGSLKRRQPEAQDGAALAAAVDGLAAFTLWFALAPWPEWQPLAALGPLTIGLAQLAARSGHSALATVASDRVSLLLILALAAFAGVLPEVAACLALGLLAALLLRGPST